MADLEGRPGHENMGCDYALLEQAQKGTGYLRLYRWEPACLSFGRNEPARKRYLVEEIRSRGLDTVRRPTGGRAVWHEAELTYAVAAPCSTFGSLRETYLAIHKMLQAALVSIGVSATLAPRPSGRSPGLNSGACFAGPVGGEILCGGRKLVGSAQFREGNAFLQHGSILMDPGQDRISSLSRGPSLASTETGLNHILGTPVDIRIVTSVIFETAQREWSGRWGEVDPSTVVPARFNFEDPAWTWRK